MYFAYLIICCVHLTRFVYGLTCIALSCAAWTLPCMYASALVLNHISNPCIPVQRLCLFSIRTYCSQLYINCSSLTIYLRVFPSSYRCYQPQSTLPYRCAPALPLALRYQLGFLPSWCRYLPTSSNSHKATPHGP